ncbi:MAG: PQQ-binding-like beta-propeller repeat protein [Planctomycetota bacterium]|nr:PQQ-binding-like beta-propeller repeat protein [Planctomycetota bacterium]
MHMHRSRSCLLPALLLTLGPHALAQDNPVYVDESPLARQILEQADDVAATNPAEAVRLLQELVDASGHQVVPTADGPEPIWFRSVRERVEDRLRRDPVLLRTMRETYGERADELLEAGRLAEVARRFPLTPAGLQAMSRLGTEAVEAGALHRGRTQLERVLRHPDLDLRTRTLALYGLGTVATLLGDDEALRTVTLQLDAMGADGAPTSAALRSIRLRPAEPRSFAVTELGRDTPIDALVGQSIWTTPLEQSLLNQRVDLAGSLGSYGRSDLQELAEAGWFTTIVPTVHEDTVIVNLGDTVLALDTLTGNRRWTSTRREQTLRLDPSERPAAADFIAIDGRYLVTATGHLYAAERSGQGHLLCLDAASGQLRWGLRVDGHPDIEQSDDLFISSPPVIHEGSVFVLARRVSAQQLTSEVLVAIDLVEGDVLWSRWISSAGRMRRNTITNTMSPLAADGRVYVSTGTGAVAAVDAANGDLLWIQRLAPTSNTTSPSGAARPFTHHAPVLGAAGLVCIAPDGNEVLVLDPATGAIRQAYPATTPDQWNHPTYLLADDDDLFSIGRDVRGFSAGDLETPRWTLTVGEDESTLPTGRVQMLERSLVVPLRGRILQIDRRNGTVLHELPVERTGNAIVAGDQLLIASATHIDAYTAFERARDILADRIRRRPEDVEAKLDLVRLAARAGRTDLLNTTTRELLDTLPGTDPERSERARDRLLVHLVEAMRTEPDIATERGVTLQSLLLETADRPHRELEAVLVLGDRLRETEPDRAAEVWRSILENEAMTRAWHEEDGLAAPGSVWAYRRLSEIEVPRRPVDDPPWRDPVDPDSTADVLGSLRENIRASNDATRIARALPATVDRLIAEERRDAAIGLLKAWDSRHPDRPLDTSGTQRTASEWIRLLTVPDDPIRPEDEAISVPGRISGSLLPVASGSSSTPRSEGVLIVRDDRLRSIDSGGSEERWSVDMPGKGNTLLQHDDRRISILVDHGDLRPDLLVLDARTGRTLSGPTTLSNFFADPAPAQRSRQAIRPDGRMIDPGEILLCADDDSITLVRRDGAAVGLDGVGNDDVRWTRSLPIRVLHGFLPMPEGLIVIGPDAAAPEPLAGSNTDPALYHLEHATGDIRKLAWPEQLGRFGWIARSPLNDLVLGGENGIACIGWPDHTPRWITTVPDATQSSRGWATSEAVLFMDERDGTETVRLLDLTTGRSTGELERPSYRERGLIRELDVDGHGFRVLRDSGLAIHDPDGTLVGTDGIPSEYQYEHLLTRGDRHLLLAHRQSVTDLQSGLGRGNRRHLYRLSVLDSTGRAVDLLDLYPLGSRIRAARLVGPNLLIETDGLVDLITLPTVNID